MLNDAVTYTVTSLHQQHAAAWEAANPTDHTYAQTQRHAHCRKRQAERQRQRNVDTYTINHIWHDIPTPLWSTEQKCLTSSNTFFCIFWIEHLRAILGNLQPCHNLFITVNHRKCWSILVLSLYRVMPCLWKRNEIFFILIHHRKR